VFACRLQDHPNSGLEDNKFCLSVHYRKMDPQHHLPLINAVKALVHNEHPDLETKDGRKVVEVRPKVCGIIGEC
jgi:trehalose 6-phosphate phosphatase